MFWTVVFSDPLFLEETNGGNEERGELGVTNAPESELFWTEQESGGVSNGRITRRRTEKVGGIVFCSALSRGQ